MGDKSGIQWTDATWNPVTGCSKVSEGCRNCYAEREATGRLRGTKGYPGLPWTKENAPLNMVSHVERLSQPLRWRRPRRIFVNSMSDLFHELVPDVMIASILATIVMARHHQFQVLTKRADRMRRFFAEYGEPPRNLWIGVSVEDGHVPVVARLDELLRIRTVPGAVKFVSAEPLLGPLDLSPWLQESGDEKPWEHIAWVIVGGESGPGARSMDVAWVRDIVRQCREERVACFVKQLGARPFLKPPVEWEAPERDLPYLIDNDGLAWPGLRSSKGGDPEEWPEDLRVRQYPYPEGGSLRG